MLNALRKKDLEQARVVREGLRNFEALVRQLPGISSRSRRLSLVMQIIESIRRVDFIAVVASRPIDPRRADPSSALFDPVRAAIYLRSLDIEEAYWLVFLFVHFGKNNLSGWRLVRDVYGRLGEGNKWSWARVSADPGVFKRWIAENEGILKGSDGVKRGFGNHRKYETLRAESRRGTGAVVESYVNWVSHYGSHQALADSALDAGDSDARQAFAHWYASMSEVMSFGRTARFDFLTMIGKIGLAPIAPNLPYLQGATGPLIGSRLLFHGDANASANWRDLEQLVVSLEDYVSLGPFAMQILEDSLCNWQKSPDRFVPFRG